MISAQEAGRLRDLLNNGGRGRDEMMEAAAICKEMKFCRTVRQGIGPAHQGDSEGVFVELFRHARVKVYRKNAVLILENDERADRSYALLGGCVGIFRQSSDMGVGGLEEGKEDLKKDRGGWKEKSEGKMEKEVLTSETKRLEKIYGSFLDFIGVGYMFGLDSIITQTVRNSTCVCVEDSEVIVFDIKGFTHIIKHLSERYAEKRDDIDRLMPGLLNKYGYKRTVRFVQTFNYIDYPKVDDILSVGNYSHTPKREGRQSVHRAWRATQRLLAYWWKDYGRGGRICKDKSVGDGFFRWRGDTVRLREVEISVYG